MYVQYVYVELYWCGFAYADDDDNFTMMAKK